MATSPTSEKLSYSDPSLQILQFLQGLGGSKTSGQTVTSTTGANPAAIDGLTQILNSQLGGITPEGAQQLLQSVFYEGAKKVPELQAAFAQSAGARTANNSPLMLQLGNLQAELAARAAQLLSQNQQNAATTARTLGDVTRTETKTASGTTTKPGNNAMMLLPFLLGQADKIPKIKQVVDSLTSGLGGGSGATALTAPSVNLGASSPASTGITSTGPDISSFATVSPVASGGDITPTDLPAIGGDLSFLDSAPTLQDITGGSFGVPGDVADSIFSDFSFANGGLVSRARLGKPTMKAKGYANGGVVNGVDTRFPSGARNSSTPVRGINFLGGPPATPALSAPGANSPARPLTIDDIANHIISNNGVIDNGSGSDSGEASTASPGAATSGVGIGGLGLAGSVVGALTGVPGLGTVAGLANSQSNSQAAITMGMAVLGMLAPQMAPLAMLALSLANDNNSNAANDTANADVSGTVNGMSTVDAVTGAPASTVGDLDSAVDAAIGDLGGTDGDSGDAGVGGGIGGSGNSAGDASGGEGGTGASGDGSGTGGDAASAANGGNIQGPGTGTSDSIPVHLSDGEYVMPADTVRFFGLPMLDFMRQISHTPVNGGR